MLDINLFRTGMHCIPAATFPTPRHCHACCRDKMLVSFTEKGGDPELVKESQRRRYADTSLVDKVVELDGQWRDGALLAPPFCCDSSCAGILLPVH